MRIIHVIESLDPKHGGPPEVAACLAAAQAAGGHRVAIAAVPSPSERKLIDGVPGFDRVKRIDVAAPKGPARGLFDRSPIKPLAAAMAGFDVAHFHNVWDSVLPLAAAAARKANLKYVLTPHGMLDTWSLAQHAARKKFAMATTHRALLRGATTFHCLNDYEAKTVDALRLGPKTCIVPNGVWLERIDGAAQKSFRGSHPELGDAPVILFLSRLHHKKGLDYLMDAFDIVAAKHATVRLAIAGPDGGELATLKERIARSPAAARVHVVGPLYGDDKFAALAECACFCLPSRQEGFPMAVLEALASRAPVVISDQCHVEDAASSGAGFIVPLDATKVAAAISRILGAPDARSFFGGAGRRLVEQKYTWTKVAEATEAMYREASRVPSS
jgi:glycosyltransferase involved in cell wall biosynthesis